MHPVISVIIPFYNVEKYIAECLDSVLSQSYQDIEILCVDDGSTDGSRAIAERYAAEDPRVKVLDVPGVRGIGPARNAGMDAMTGDYLLFLDSDDLLAENAIQNLYDIMVRSGADIVTGRFSAFADEDRADLQDSAARLNATFALMHAEDVQVTVQNFQRKLDVSYGVVWGRLFNTDFMRKKAIRFHNSDIYHEDKGFFLKCFGALPHLAFVEEDVVRYRVRAHSSMTEACIEQKNKRRHDIAISVMDGVEHIYQMHDATLAAQLVSQVKSHRSFAPYFDKKHLGGLLRLRWYRHEKLVEFCRVELYREKILRSGEKIYRVCGIVVRREAAPSCLCASVLFLDELIADALLFCI